jgi:hypothetical protein
VEMRKKRLIEWGIREKERAGEGMKERGSRL